MKTLLVVATRKEIQPLLTEFQVNKLADNLYTTTFIHLGELDILITGIGIPFTMYHLMETLSYKTYNLVIDAGVAGSYNDKMPIGTIVQVVQEEFADIGMEDHKKFFTIFESKWIDLDFSPFHKGKLKVIEHNIDQINKLPKANSITVNISHGRKDSIELFKNKFNPDIENMEGAAIFYICQCKHIQVVQVRCISNFVELRDETKWELQKSIDSLNHFLIDLFHQMNKK